MTKMRRIVKYGEACGMPLPREAQPQRSLTLKQVLCIAYLFVKILCSVFAVPETDEFAVKVIVISTGVYIFFGFFSGLFFYSWGGRLLGLLGRLDGVNLQILELGCSEEFLREYRETGRRLERFTSVMTGVIFLAAATFTTSIPVLDLLDGRYATNPWPIKAQSKPAQALGRIRPLFELIVLEEIMAYMVPGTSKFLTECIMICLLKVQSIQFSYLSHVLVNVPVITDNAPNRTFLAWLKIHQDTVQNFHKMVDFLSPLLVVWSMGTITMIAGTLIYLVQAETPNVFQSISGSTYMSISMLQLFLLSNATEKVKDISEKIAFDMYSIPWYEMRTEERHYVRMVINIANYRVYVEGFKAQSFRINRETYLNIFVSTVSAYIGLMKLIEINDSGLEEKQGT